MSLIISHNRKQKLSVLNTKPINISELKNTLQAIWANLRQGLTNGVAQCYFAKCWRHALKQPVDISNILSEKMLLSINMSFFTMKAISISHTGVAIHFINSTCTSHKHSFVSSSNIWTRAVRDSIRLTRRIWSGSGVRIQVRTMDSEYF